MSDLERELRRLGERTAQDLRNLEPRVDISRRARKRRFVFVSGSATVALFIGGIALATQPWEAESPTPPAPAASTTTSGRIELASGGTDRPWELSARASEDEFCFSFTIEDPSPLEWCYESILPRGQWVVLDTFKPDAREKLIFGAITDGARMSATVASPARDVTLIPSPEGFPDEDLMFFVVESAPEIAVRLDVFDEGGSVIASETLDGTPTFARFPLKFGHGKDRDNGILEVDAREATVCSTGSFPLSKAAHIHRDRRSGEFASEVVVTLFEPPTRFASPICLRGIDPVVLLRFLDDPRHHHVDYHESEKGPRHLADVTEPWQTNVKPQPSPEAGGPP